ncbi:class A beta-lactamase [Rhizobium mongolense]|uniref:Beta-lactamase n=2 Tax=Rhizobium mongolense TaxID=57676 RepID=A0A7W6RL03_9HYPH|nr:class A beta-lactamase [Rhizobium mongolense]MBB4228096.1 beta-lactamase class A [Rhizobium mongolense]MBB4274362.1 beta-lactamase class A [Rhizobium mongolense]TVZ64755.1 beta-lactamase class A [Rhizobium mongolense USDA 1844]
MNDFSIHRRTILKTAMLFPALSLASFAGASETDDDIERRLAELEKRTGGRLGISVIDTETKVTLGYRETERFPMCSTFKVLASAMVLSRVDKGDENLERRVIYSQDKLVSYSPETEKHVGGEGMSVGDLCKAAITLSDNTAGNLLLESVAGPKALTKWLRSIGDRATRLDRWETALNEGKKGDPRDTTTPDAMLDTLGNLALGSVLSEPSREKLIEWMLANTTGDARLRAGLPGAWKVGDKTGTGDNGSAADIAIIWPKGRGPILVTAYIAEATAPVKELNPVFAEVAKIVAGMTG